MPRKLRVEGLRLCGFDLVCIDPAWDVDGGEGMDGIDPRTDEDALLLVFSALCVGLACAGRSGLAGKLAGCSAVTFLGERAKPNISALIMRSSSLSLSAILSCSSRRCSSSSASAWSESLSESDPTGDGGFGGKGVMATCERRCLSVKVDEEPPECRNRVGDVCGAGFAFGGPIKTRGRGRSSSPGRARGTTCGVLLRVPPTVCRPLRSCS